MSHQRKFFRIGFASWLCTCLAACLLWVTAGCDSKSTSVDSIGDQASVSRGGEDGDDSDSIDQGRPDAAGGSEPEFNREAALTAADRLLRSGQTEKAILELQRVLVSDPEDSEVLFRLANAQASLGELASGHLALRGE